MESYKRFNDENYKHWLQAAESLYILRSHIRQFVENETETYHQCLRGTLKNDICKSKCSLLKWSLKVKKFPICDHCERWKDAILSNHNQKVFDIHWNNCQPHLWPTDKWEVAKAYMIRGVKNHHSYDQFDISAILNFMLHCKYFKTFTTGQCLSKVINTRNKVMHSPDFTLSKEEMNESLKNVQELAKILEKHEPGLKTVSEKIQQFKGILKKWSGQNTQSTEDSKKETLKLLDREQHALKEKIEFLAQCYENGQGTELKLQEELQGMKNFLEQNKDLLENLGPQVMRLNEIQEKVNKHEQDIGQLYTRVNRLETVAPDPLFSGDVLRYKNHLLEEAQRRNMPEPVFTEEREASGYRGFVNVNGQTFRGVQVCNKRTSAHQEVAKIALDYMDSHPEWQEETITTLSSSTSSSSTIRYGTVTVFLKNQEVVSDSCDHKEEASESAYRKVARQFGLTSPESNTFRTAVLEHFQRCNFPAPLELSVCQGDKTLCKLQISGGFTFYDKDGSSKKKQAEQQAAKVALQNLSGILNCRSLANAGDNWKGFLKEHLDALGLQQPDYDCKIVCISQEVEEASTTDDSSQLSMTKVNSKNDSIQSKISDSEVQDRPTVHTIDSVDCQETETLDSSPPETSNQTSKMDFSGTIYYCVVVVFLNNQEVVSDECVQEEEATESAYRKLACLFGLKSLKGKTDVLEHFQRCKFPTPQERLHCEDNKFLCKLVLSGYFTFTNKDGSIKKKQAEQQASMVALQHLSGLFNCSFEVEPGKNYKGLLMECLKRYGLKPVYNVKTNRDDVTEELEGFSKSEDNSHCTADECQVTKTLDSNPSEMSIQAPKMDCTEIIFYGIVTVILNNQEVISDGCVHQEKAIESAYRKLACQFGLMSFEGKTVVQEYFQRCNFPLPVESLSPAGNKFFCKLQLCGAFTFFDKDGALRKKQAEQQAAKVALQHLSGLFNCSFKAETCKNYKGFLKEQLDALHLNSPDYRCKQRGEINEEMEAPSTSGDSSHSSCMTSIVQNFCLQPNNSLSQECAVTETQDAGLLDIPNVSPNMDNTDINTLLAAFHLKPPSVTVEIFKIERIFSCHVTINLDKFTFQNNSDYTIKKDAICKTYVLLGNALGISKTMLDECNDSMLVKQHFSQKSLTLPKEAFEDNKCSLHDITYNLVYDGDGSTETEAQQDALHKALDTLTLLFGYKYLPKCSTVEETKLQINSLLKIEGQKDLIYSPKHILYKSSVGLLFKDYTMERKCQTKKKENVNHLSKCILGLLAVETDPNTPIQKCLVDWFNQKNLKQPVFENTKEAHGSKVTFSVNVSCSSPNGEDSVKAAQKKMLDELKKRLKCLTD